MNVKLILKTLGKVLLIEAAYMLLSLLVGLYYGESPLPFAPPILAMLAAAAALSRLRPRATVFNAREGLVGVALIWLAMSLFGALPFAINGGFGSPIDCFFESVSGFTTTGASILPAVEQLPRGILFWRSSTHWLGGMGVLVLVLALFPSIGERAQNLMAAESPGPTSEKLTPRISTSSKILYGIYMGLTVTQILCLLLTGMNWFDAVVNTFATAGTGGFSVLNASIAGYHSAAAEWIITVFMLLYGVNFTVFFLLLTRQFKRVARNSELIVYLSVAGGATLVIAASLYARCHSVGLALRHAAFNTVSIMTTTGFVSADYDTWPELCKLILVVLMIVGASAGSTGGGMKCSRLIILCKSITREIRRMVSPKRVSVLRLDGRPLPEATVTNTAVFAMLYFLIAIGSMLLVAMDNFDFTTNVTAVLACLGNVGPALGAVAGPTGNYAAFSGFSKLVLSVCMLVGRLEIYPMLALVLPATWKNASLKK